MTAAALFGDTLLYTSLPVSAARLGLDALAVGLVLSLNRWVRLVTNPVAARLFERAPGGRLVVWGLALAVASTAAYALPALLLVFLAARLVWGMSWSLLRLGSLLGAVEGTVGRTGRALGDMRAVFGLGLADLAVGRTFVLSTLAATASIAAVTMAGDATAFVALGALAFFAGITSVVAVELAIAHRTTTADRARILGAYNTWADVGAAAGALGGGALALAGTHLPIALGAALAAGTLILWRSASRPPAAAAYAQATP